MDVQCDVKVARLGTLSLLVRQIRFEAVGINSYELVDADGGDLPAFAAGSHLDFHLGDGLIRQYSLCGDPNDRRRYSIAVLRETNGRGGSRRLHATLHVQDKVETSLPRCNFELDPNASRHLLIAGGIGITPIKAMLHALTANDAKFEVHYCARDRAYAAFADELVRLGGADRMHLHFDGADPSRRLDVGGLLHDYVVGTHLYYCGPPGLMAACATAAAHWPTGTVHSELFQAPVPLEAVASANTETGSFTVELASSGTRIPVPEGRSIADALNDHGVVVPTSCVSGLCGTCKLRYLSGDVDHRDYILSEDERREYLTSCVSRASSPILTLDL